jgi:hypothetical protein
MFKGKQKRDYQREYMRKKRGLTSTVDIKTDTGESNQNVRPSKTREKGQQKQPFNLDFYLNK